MNYGWTFVGIGFLCLLVLMGCAAPDASPEIPDQNTDQNNPVFPPDENTPLSPPVTRSFEQGFVPIPPQPITEAGWMDTFRLLGRNADVVLHHSAIDWNKFSENANAPRSADKTPNLEQTNFVALMAKQNQLNVLIVVDPLRSDRLEIDPNVAPIGFKFQDSAVRAAFRNYTMRIVRDYKPKYLGIGSEINTYMRKHPEDALFLISAIKEIIAEVKYESPDTIVTTTFQFEELTGKVNGSSQWDLLEQIEPSVDVVAITTYPSPFFESPGKIPEDYYRQLGSHTQKPVIIAESGWPSAGEPGFHGSEQNQAEFIKRLPVLTQDLNLQVWIWWFLHDWSGEGYADFFKSMGLRTSDGNEKPAWQAFRDVRG
ncbi:MAG: hypothetical protein J4215_00345 [Candidatus Diapherotrites archaeon]|uniref:Uncharacterized protein n=1 Tax=Candidatus Iainarchaeum sp. TaxID=3101447 RepID=A0A8T4L160_9ARCH|nr:hypothetical protein [Candidatus Diapherotrites archaeon]